MSSMLSSPPLAALLQALLHEKREAESRLNEIKNQKVVAEQEFSAMKALVTQRYYTSY